MKKILFAMLILCGMGTNLVAQTYKLEPIFHDTSTETSLSHWRQLDSLKSEKEIFSLWGNRRYGESWVDNVYEVEFFNGDAAQMYTLLSEVCDFTTQYKNEDGVITYISGVQVKTAKWGAFKYTFVYDSQRKIVCLYKDKQWTHILDKFTTYCHKHSIRYK